MHIERRHEYRDHQALIIEKFCFLHFFDGHDPPIRSGQDMVSFVDRSFGYPEKQDHPGKNQQHRGKHDIPDERIRQIILHQKPGDDDKQNGYDDDLVSFPVNSHF
jgi:hypothetical protein